MIDPELKAELDAMSVKIDAAYVSSQKVRKYLQWTLITSIVLFVLPLLGLIIAIPAFLTNYAATLKGAGI